MRDLLELRSPARRCRMMTDTSLSPSVNKQIRLWAAELAEMADEVERRRGTGHPTNSSC
jgi:hypothetical protein